MSELGEYMRYMKEKQEYLLEMINYRRSYIEEMRVVHVVQLCDLRFPFYGGRSKPTVKEAKKQLKEFLDRFPMCRSDSLVKIINRVQIYIQEFPDIIENYLMEHQ